MSTAPFELYTLEAIKRGKAKQIVEAAAPVQEDWSKIEYELPAPDGTPAPEAAAQPPAPPAQPEEKMYEYQPVNEDGIPIGGKQVIKYHTQDELIQKMQKNHEEAIRQIRRLNTKVRL